jgi:protein-L-isoaspartate(D-aspartate) O-methyltransferase
MNFAAARHNMVESQLRTNKVNDPAVLEAFDSVPREMFAPPERRSLAYVDEDLAIARGRYLMEPMVLARLVQLAVLRPSARALDVGCGSGYSSAILARVAASVVALESEPALARQARAALAELGLGNAHVVEGELPSGWPSGAPYDAILINGMIEVLPPALIEQLAEGGRLACVQRRDGVGRATVMTKIDGVASSRVVFEAAVPPLPGFLAPAGFVF